MILRCLYEWTGAAVAERLPLASRPAWPDSLQRHARRIGFAAALLILLGIGIGLRRSLPPAGPILGPDSYSYLGSSAALSTPRSWSNADFTPRRTPGYPLVLRLLHVRTGSERSLVLFQQGLGILSTVLLYFLAYHFTRSLTLSFLAAILTSIAGQTVYYEYSLLSDTLSAATFLAAIALLVASVQRDAPLLWVGLGLAVGAAALVRPSNLPAFGVALLYAGFHRPALRTPRRRFASALCLLVAIAILLAPWVERNRRLFGRPMLTSSEGYSLMLREGPFINYESGLDRPLKDLFRQELQAVHVPAAEPVHQTRMKFPQTAAAEIELNDRMKWIAVEAIRTHPLRYATGTVYEFLALLKSYGQPVGFGPALIPPGRNALHDLGLTIETYWTNFAFAAALFLLLLASIARGTPAAFRALSLTVLAYLAAQALVITGIERYRLTVQGLLYLSLVAAPIVLWRNCKRRDLVRASSTTAAAMLVLFAVATWEAAQRPGDLGPIREQIDAVHPILTWPWTNPYSIYLKNHGKPTRPSARGAGDPAVILAEATFGRSSSAEPGCRRP
jgi:4-amino-4-deoxy-L-arabinose transferase-like glycosyltransferase